MYVDINICRFMSKPVPFTTTLEVRDGCLCLHAQRAARGLARRFDRALRPFGITNQQFSILMSLNRSEPPGVGAVASLLGMDRTTLTAALKPLRAHGLVTISPDPDDGRGRRIELQQQGECLLADALPAWRACHAEIEAALPLIDWTTLRASLAALA